jgi:hypothetical protein
LFPDLSDFVLDLFESHLSIVAGENVDLVSIHLDRRQFPPMELPFIDCVVHSVPRPGTLNAVNVFAHGYHPLFPFLLKRGAAGGGDRPHVTRNHMLRFAQTSAAQCL